MEHNGGGVKINRHRSAETSDYVIRSTCGVWRIGLAGGKVARIVLPPSPPAAGRTFKWLGVSGRKMGGRAGEKIPPALRRLMAQIGRYFSGARGYPAAPIVFLEGSHFERNVWECLRFIPAGWTMTYGGLAESLGSPRACRAVGNACAANPLPLLVPCHRVVGKRGLGGFSAGRKWKEFLLSVEGA